MLTSTMFTALLKGSEPSETTHRQAYAHAVRTSNVPLLKELLASSRLPADIDAEIAETDALDVLAAWATAPGRTTDAILTRFAKETRATLLLNLAEAAGLPDELYRQLARRKSTTICWELIANASAPPDVKLDSARFLGPSTTLSNSGVVSRIKPLYTADEDVVLAFVSGNRNRRALEALLDNITDVSDRVLVAVATAAATAALDAPNERIYAVISKTVMMASDAGRDVPELERIAQDAVDSQAAPGMTAVLANTLTIVRNRRIVDVDAYLAAVVDAATPAALAQAVSNFDRMKQNVALGISHDAAYANAVIANASCVADFVTRFQGQADVDVRRAACARAVAARNLGLARTWFGYGTSTQVFERTLFDEAVARAADKADLLAWATDGLTSAPNWLVASDTVRQSPELALRYLPITSVAGNAKYSPAVEALLAHRIGANPAVWETFTGLLDDWSGTFEGVVDAAVNLT